jgi:hypothetical protein
VIGNEIGGEARPGDKISIIDGPDERGRGWTKTCCMEILRKFDFCFVHTEDSVDCVLRFLLGETDVP